MIKPNSNWLTACALTCLGGLNVLGFAPFDWFFVPIVTLTVLILSLNKSSAKQALGYGWCYGLGWFGAGISWVHVSIDTYGGIPLIASLGLMLMLVGYLAIYPALACWLTVKYSPSKNYWWLSFVAFWFICEYLRSIMFTGFPWLSLGYSQFTSPLKVFAPVIGEIGLTLLMCVISVSVAQAISSRLKQWHVASIVLVAVTSLTIVMPTKWTQSLNDTKSVALVQGNIEQSIRWQPENEWPTYLKYLDLTRPHYQSVDLVIWPESAIPMLEPLAQEELFNLDKSAAISNTALITGIIDFQTNPRVIYNGLVTLGLRNPQDKQGQYYYQHQNRYNKHHLLPIGEFVPFEDWLRPLAPIFDLPMSSFTRGDYRQPNLRANGISLVPAICYEIIFAEQIRQNITSQTDMILTVSNDAWFGLSVGPLQHMQIAQMRALEFGRPLLRATNTGVSAVTDEYGNIIAKLAQFEDAVLTADVELVTGTTPYLAWGNKPLWLLTIMIFALLLVQNLRQSRQTS